MPRNSLGGEVIFDSSPCVVVRRAKTPGEGSTDQAIFHNGRIDGKRATITCYNFTPSEITIGTIPAAPGEPAEPEDLYYAVQDNFGDFYIIQSLIREEFIHMTMDGPQTLATTTDTIEYDVESFKRDPRNTYSLVAFELTISRDGLYLFQPLIKWTAGSGTTSINTFLEEDTGGGFAEYVSSLARHETNPNDFGFLTQPMTIPVVSGNVYRMRGLLGGSAGRSATLAGPDPLTPREGAYWIVTRLGP